MVDNLSPLHYFNGSTEAQRVLFERLAKSMLAAVWPDPAKCTEFWDRDIAHVGNDVPVIVHLLRVYPHLETVSGLTSRVIPVLVAAAFEDYVESSNKIGRSVSKDGIESLTAQTGLDEKCVRDLITQGEWFLEFCNEVGLGALFMMGETRIR